MSDFQGQFIKFNLDEGLKAKFRDFDSVYGTKKPAKKLYRIISVTNNEVANPETKLNEENDGKLA